MSGNNCDDAFQQIRDLQDQNRELQKQADDMERQLRAAGVYSKVVTGDGVIVPGQNGPLEMKVSDVRRSYQQLAGKMSSQEVDDLLARGFDTAARPVGSEGRFLNYDRLLQQVQVKNKEDFARFVEALGILSRDHTPDDFAFMTEKYGRDRVFELAEKYLRDLGASRPDIMAKAATMTAPMLSAVENKVWLRFWSDRSINAYIDTLEQIRDYMNAIPGDATSDTIRGLQEQAFNNYLFAKVMQRSDAIVTRRHAQALRSQQDVFDIGPARVDFEDPEIDRIFEMKPGTVDKDEHIARVIEAVDNRDATQMSLLIDTARLGMADPKSPLDKDWFNTHMRLGNALIKDSQLGNIQTQIRMNAGSNVAMFFYGPLQQTFENGVKLVPVGTQLTRGPLLEAAQISAQAHQYAWNALKATWKRDMDQVFRHGISNYSGNMDTYGKRLLTNQQELDDMQEILDMPYRPGANPLVAFLHPENAAIFTNKLQAAARILAFTKPHGAKEFSRIEAAWNALSLGDTVPGRQQVRVKDIDTFVPWKPYLRTMAAVDEVFGKYHFLYKLKADAEVRARLEGNQLGLFNDQDRAAWVQRQIDDAIYSNTPTESDIKAFRKLHGLRGSDFTDDDIAALLAEANMAGAPKLDTPEGVAAMEHSATMRFQNSPKGGLAEKLDQGMMSARQDWRVDRFLMPYWRSMFNGVLLDHRLATFGIMDTAKMLGGSNPSPELVARVKAGWVMSGGLLAAFGALDAAGLIKGGNDPTPDKRNTIAGIRLGGIPVVNTLFLWKDVLDSGKSAVANDYDGQELLLATMKVLTNHVVRQSGIQQVQMLMDFMLDGSRNAGERLRQLAAFVGSGQVPFIGHIRDLERLTGMSPRDFYRDAAETPAQNYLLEKDNPAARAEQFLRNWAYDTSGLVAAATGAKRKTTDHLGSPIGHIFGINLAKALPFVPAAWPSGKINDTVYSELEAQDLLDPPRPLMTRVLEGIAMSDDLQEEYNDIHGKIKGNPKLPPTARLGLAGAKVQAYFPLPIETVGGSGIRFKEGGGVSLPLSQIVDGVTAGKTKKEAFYALFTSPVYQAMEDNPITSANPPGGLPKVERRKRTAQLLINAVTAYYDLLTQDELERRAAAGTSAAAKQWSDAKTELADQVFKRSIERVRVTAPLLNQGQGGAQ